MRKILIFACSLLAFGATENALAQPQSLSWEHALTTRTSKSKYPLSRVKIYNNWTPDSHRMLLKYNVAGMGATSDMFSQAYGSAFSMPSFEATRLLKRVEYHHGTLGFVQRLGDNKLIGYSSEAGDHGGYFTEDRKTLMKRLRFDPWKKLAPELSREKPPSLTPAQRHRLGREVRSTLRPMMKEVVKTYFRPLPDKRTFTVGAEQMQTRGFRMTALLNAGGYSMDARWMRLSFEWWLAPEMSGDGIARQFFGKLLSDYRELGGPTTSMWMNETLPLMWASLPQELHLAAATFLPAVIEDAAGTSTLMLGGTPVYIGATVMQPEPRYGRCPACGEMHVEMPGVDWNSIRLEMQLQNRNTQPLRLAIFDAPPEYEKESLEPILAKWDESVGMIQGAFDRETLLAEAPHSNEYSWRALKDYTRKANALLLKLQ